MNQITDFVKHVIIINVIVFVAVYYLLPNMGLSLDRQLSLYFPLSADFKPFQIITHMFMHASISHIAFNMLSLFFLGPHVERALGIKKMFILYFVCGITAMLAHQGIDWFQYYMYVDEVDLQLLSEWMAGNYRDPGNLSANGLSLARLLMGPMLGASGAVMGVTIAFAVLYPNMKMMLMFIPFPVKAKYLAAGIVAYDVLFGAGGVSDGIAHFAHVGGAIAGFILTYYWKKKTWKR